MRSTSFIFAVCICLWIGCGADPFEDELNFSIITDTLEISIVLDETPGFAYPMMRHSVKFVGFMNVPGVISHYSYRSEGVERSVVYDYFSDPPPAGTRFKDEFLLWDTELLAVGTPVAYAFGAYGSGGIHLERREALDVESFTDGPRPAASSMQLTGPARRNFQPAFSGDGQWIYYRGYDRNESIYSIHRVSVDGSVHEPILESTESIGGITLIDDEVLVFARWQPQQPSLLVELNLVTRETTETVLGGSLWDSPLVPIPGTTQLIGLLDPNTTDNDLALVDMETGAVETLVPEQDVGGIFNYDYRPGTSQVSFVARGLNDDITVFLLDLNTRQWTPYINDFEGYQLMWKSNGEDFAYVRFNESFEQNIFLREGGIDRQLTIYPGDETDIAMSPDGAMIAYTARRRAETQVWRLDL